MRDELYKLLVINDLKNSTVQYVTATPLKEKMQTTVELEMDFFYEILTDSGERFILHLEFESGDNLEMIYRVSEYHGMALRRHKLPIRHLVIYLGIEPPKMRTQLRSEEVFQGFDLVNAHDLDTNELLSSQIPEVVLIAILSNFDREDAEQVLQLIIAKLKRLVGNTRIQKKYFNQLMTLSRLRKLEALTIKIVEEMPIHFDYETDTLFLKGEERGVKKGAEKEAAKKDRVFATYLVLNTEHSDEQIASIVGGLSVEYVQKLRIELKNEQ